MKGSSNRSKGKKTNRDKKGSTLRVINVCPLCEKPHKLRTQLCSICNKRAKDLSAVVSTVRGKASIGKLLWLQTRYNTDDIFTLIENNPSLYFDGSSRKERQMYKRDVRAKQRGDFNRAKGYLDKIWELLVYRYAFLRKRGIIVDT